MLARTANLRTEILDLGGFDSSRILIVNSHVHRELPGEFELSNLSRNNLSREIGRTHIDTAKAAERKAGDGEERARCLQREGG